jgi:hypothetical protein
MKTSHMKTFASILLAGAIVVFAGCATGTTTPDIPEAGPTTTCGVGSQTCNGVCTTLARDPENCGVCGGKCKDGEVCSMGKCALACGPGTLRCLNVCVASQSDPGNCGTCGVKCKMGEVCSMGKCAQGCAGGTTACGQSCVDTQSDRTNCGACGTMCGTGEECIAGKCALTCQTGLVACPNNYADAGATDAGTFGPTMCTDTWVDRFNCGACGKVCGPSTPLCKQGQCVNPPSTCNNAACMQGADVTNANLKWVVCSANCNTAWVSHLTSSGGQYHAEWICKQLGYNTFNAQGGTCNDVCSYCQANTSCNAPGPANFTGGGACGQDQYGKILCNTVMWQCTM